MIADIRLFTAAQASAVSGINVKAVNNAIDKHVIVLGGSNAKDGRRVSRRLLTGQDLVLLKVWHGVGSVLPVEKRACLFQQIKAEPLAKTVKADELLIVDVGAARKQVSDRIKELDAAEMLIQADPHTMGGEPVFRGTRIPVYAIVAMLEAGADREDLLSGYPGLDDRKLDLGQLWVTAHPRRGRPKRLADHGVKATSVKKVTLKSDPLS